MTKASEEKNVTKGVYTWEDENNNFFCGVR
jgi:hypothetical protein